MNRKVIIGIGLILTAGIIIYMVARPKKKTAAADPNQAAADPNQAEASGVPVVKPSRLTVNRSRGNVKPTIQNISSQLESGIIPDCAYWDKLQSDLDGKFVSFTSDCSSFSNANCDGAAPRKQAIEEVIYKFTYAHRKNPLMNFGLSIWTNHTNSLMEARSNSVKMPVAISKAKWIEATVKC